MLVRLQRSKQSKQTSKKLTAFPEGRTVSFLNTFLNAKYLRNRRTSRNIGYRSEVTHVQENKRKGFRFKK